MKNAGSTEKLSNSGGTSVASRVRSLFSSSPISRRKRAMSLDALSSVTNTAPSPARVLGIPLADLVAKDGIPVPFIVKKIVRHVEDFGLDQVGIYRINGNVKVIEKLRESFDKVGDANFNDEDIASVAGLLKLFLRELPDGIVPEILMQHFVSVQQSHPSEATPDALEALQNCLRYLPEPNYNVLRYLIRHMVKVAEHSDQNKMTAVSLAIVFGPNLFHCGAGLEGLRLQGFSNAAVCRMVQNHKVLFPRGKKWGVTDPPKPRPYLEHVAEKKRDKENARADLSATYDVAASPFRKNPHIAALSDLDRTTFSERSIDDAIYERSQGTLSPTSPAHLLDNSQSNSTSPIQTSASVSQSQVLSALPSGGLESGDHEETEMWARQEGQEEEEEEDEDGAGFQRRNAKRGLSYRPLKRTRSSPVHTGNGDGSTLKHPQVASLTTAGSRTSDEDHLMPLNMSPASWQSSPGTSPPTSPALTPRGTRIFSSTVGATVKDLLFQPNVDESKVHAAKKDVYGLLLPEGRKHPSPAPNVALVTKVLLRKSTPSDSDVPSGGSTEDGGPVYAVVKRRKKNPAGQRNRRSVLHGTNDSSDGTQTVSLNETSIQLISVASESDVASQEGGGDSQGGVAVRSRVGKVSDLVKQFDGSQHGAEEEEEEEEEEKERGVGGEMDRGEGGGKKRLSRNTLEMFEKTGIIMGMGAPKKRSGSVSAANSTSETALSSTSPPYGSTSHVTSDSSDWVGNGSIVSDSVGSSRVFAGPSGGVAIIQTSTTTSDEEVFASPNHSPDCVPVIGPTHRDLLSTTTSDDVFLSSPRRDSNLPSLPRDRNETDGGMEGTSDKAGPQFDEFARKGPTLEHLTLSRPKGPKSRKPPTRAFQPTVNAISEDVPLHSPSREAHGPTLPLKSSPLLPASPRSARHRRSTRNSSHTMVDAGEERGEITSTIEHSLRHKKSSSSHSASRTNMAPVSINSLGSPQDSSPHTSPSSQSREKLHPRLDLVAQAPESKQAVSAVKKGWSEAGTAAEKSKDYVVVEKARDRVISTKELSHRIRELKGSVREYEAEFVSKNGRKPSNHEKSPIRSKLIELSKLKKTYHELQASLTTEDQLSKTAPPDVTRQAKDSPVRRISVDLPSSTLPLDSSVKVKHTPSATTTKGTARKTSSTTDIPVVSDGTTPSNPPSSLELVLKNILQNLEARRTSGGRPEQLELMTEAQLLQEKHSIQKILLNYERQHGRPQSRTDKDIMRPLYDRYRAIKRACGKSSTRESTKDVTRHTQEESGLNTSEPLPTVTLLQSSITLGANDLSKTSDSLVAEGGSRSIAQAEPLRTSREERSKDSNHTVREKRSGHRRQSDSHRKLSESYTATPREPRLGHATQLSDHRRMSGDLKTRILTERELQSCSRSELKLQKDLLLMNKAELRKVLKKFESSFTEKYGRTVTKQDRHSMEREYAQYKTIKGKLRLIEAFLAKPEPHLTI